jgi:CheY-like chemotaxis protein
MPLLGREPGLRTSPGDGGRTGSVKLILLEDDPLIAVCTKDALADSGFEVLAAASGAEALAILAQSPDVVAMVIDVRLDEPPDGWEVARRARRTHPHLAIVYSTTVGPAGFHANAVDRSTLLEKPYTLERAVAVMRGAIAPAGECA